MGSTTRPRAEQSPIPKLGSPKARPYQYHTASAEHPPEDGDTRLRLDRRGPCNGREHAPRIAKPSVSCVAQRKRAFTADS